MDTTLPDCDLERKAHLERLDKILGQLPHENQAEVWQWVALNVAERYYKAKR